MYTSKLMLKNGTCLSASLRFCHMFAIMPMIPCGEISGFAALTSGYIYIYIYISTYICMRTCMNDCTDLYMCVHMCASI